MSEQRLIDANKLTVTHINEVDVLGYKLKYGTGIPVVRLAEIEHAPTIEPQRQSGREVYQAGYADGYKAGQEERKTGKWIRETKYYKDSEQEFYYYEERCSECGTKRKIGWAEVIYCPMCGARLVQEGEDNERA